MAIKSYYGKGYARIDWDFIRKCFTDQVFVGDGLVGLCNS